MSENTKTKKDTKAMSAKAKELREAKRAEINAYAEGGKKVFVRRSAVPPSPGLGSMTTAKVTVAGVYDPVEGVLTIGYARRHPKDSYVKQDGVLHALAHTKPGSKWVLSDSDHNVECRPITVTGLNDRIVMEVFVGIADKLTSKFEYLV
jgi:hypothetical protein